MSNGQQRGQYWTFTLNNYTTQEVEAIRKLYTDNIVSYIVFGYELGSEGGTPHLQGYVEFPGVKRLNQVRNYLGDRAHVERRRARNPLIAVQYCKKGSQTHEEWVAEGIEGQNYGADARFEEFGEMYVSNQGKRTDLTDIQAKIKDGTPLDVIAQEHFSQWIYHRRSFEAYANLLQPKTFRTELQNICFWGKSRTGKTRYVYDKHGYSDVFRVPSPTLEWFTGYQYQPVVLIDDYRGGASESFILQLLDGYPIDVPTKGGFVAFRPKYIYITSNIPPSELHTFSNDESRQAWKNRFHRVVEFKTLMTIEQVDAQINQWA